MGIIKAINDSMISTLQDQWKEIITSAQFTEHTVVSPGLIQIRNNGRGTNNPGSSGIISNGSKIYVPENTAAFIFSEAGIENIILTSGSYEYQDGDASIFNKDGIRKSILKQIENRIGYGGITPNQKQIAFVNLREIRGIPFGSQGPMSYFDSAYGVDLMLHAYGVFSIKVTDPTTFIQNFVPANTVSYSFDDIAARRQLIPEFLQSFSAALNSMSEKYRTSQLISAENEITEIISKNTTSVGTWESRFGLKLMHAAIEKIQLSDESQKIVNQYASKKMYMSAWDDVSQKTADITAQQTIAEGIREHGLGDMGGMVYGMNFVQGLNNNGSQMNSNKMSIDEQLNVLQKLKQALDSGILTQAEFDAKKKEILGM